MRGAPIKILGRVTIMCILNWTILQDNISNTVFPIGSGAYSWNRKIA